MVKSDQPGSNGGNGDGGNQPAKKKRPSYSEKRMSGQRKQGSKDPKGNEDLSKGTKGNRNGNPNNNPPTSI